MAAGAALEVDLVGLGEFLGRQHRIAGLGAGLFGALHDVEARLVLAAGRGFVLLEIAGGRLFLGQRRRRQERADGERRGEAGQQ